MISTAMYCAFSEVKGYGSNFKSKWLYQAWCLAKVTKCCQNITPEIVI